MAAADSGISTFAGTTVLSTSHSIVERARHAEAALCIVCNRACRRPAMAGLFAAVSRLGDGIFWYVLIALLPALYGTPALTVSARMTLAGIVGLALYKMLKARTARPRPYVALREIALGARPLDAGSFPSGHTLHAVNFTIVVTAAFPELSWLLIPFTVLIAASRLVLGLHYPSDVAAGATLGAVIAWVVLQL